MVLDDKVGNFFKVLMCIVKLIKKQSLMVKFLILIHGRIHVSFFFYSSPKEYSYI